MLIEFLWPLKRNLPIGPCQLSPIAAADFLGEQAFAVLNGPIGPIVQHQVNSLIENKHEIDPEQQQVNATEQYVSAWQGER